MSTAGPSWDLFGTFLAVMQHRSLSGAARALGVAQPTARRQIEALETELGAVLFTRASNGLVATDVAHAMVPYAEAMASTARALVRSVSGATSGESGVVRIAASEIVGVEVLPPILASLAASHPAIQVELVLSNKNEDVLRRDADVAIRMVRPTQSGLVARKLGAVEVGLFATAGYLASHPAPKVPKDLLTGHVLVGNDRERDMIGALARMGIPATPRDFAFRSDNHLAQLAAIRAGIGIGPCQVGLSRAPVPLVRVVPAVTFPLEVWLVVHHDLRSVARVRRVCDHLTDELGAYAAPPKSRR